MSVENSGEGEVLYLSKELKQAEKDSAEKERGIVAERLMGKAGGIVAEKKSLAKASDNLLRESLDALDKGVLSIEQMLVIRESFDNPVERSVLLRRCVAESVKQGKQDFAEELLGKEPDEDQKERLRGVIAIALGRIGKHIEASAAIAKMSNGERKNHAIKIIKEEKDGEVSVPEDLLAN